MRWFFAGAENPCNINPLSLYPAVYIQDIIYQPGGNQSVEFLADVNSNFNKIHDQYGNYIRLPTENQFPMNEYAINIYNPNNQAIAMSTYAWQNGNIINPAGGGTGEQHGFSFTIEQPSSPAFIGRIKMNVTTYGSGMISDFPLIYGRPANESQFLGTGNYESNHLPVSDTNILTYEQLRNGLSRDYRFFVSYYSND